MKQTKPIRRLLALLLCLIALSHTVIAAGWVFLLERGGSRLIRLVIWRRKSRHKERVVY